MVDSDVYVRIFLPKQYKHTGFGSIQYVFFSLKLRGNNSRLQQYDYHSTTNNVFLTRNERQEIVTVIILQGVTSTINSFFCKPNNQRTNLIDIYEH